VNNPYDVLGLLPGASRAEIRQAYLALARKLHPDLNPGNPAAVELLKAANLAYEALMARRPGRVESGPPPDGGGRPGGYARFGGHWYFRTPQGEWLWWSESRQAWTELGSRPWHRAAHVAGRGVAALRRRWRAPQG
jgi:hypothetical protein